MAEKGKYDGEYIKCLRVNLFRGSYKISLFTPTVVALCYDAIVPPCLFHGKRECNEHERDRKTFDWIYNSFKPFLRNRKEFAF